MTTTHRPPPKADGGKPRRSRPVGGLRAIFWNDQQQRAKAPWLVLLPAVGAYIASLAVEAATADSGLTLPVRFALWNLAAVGAAIGLVLVSARYLGARRLVDYGLVLDRRWRTDLLAGLVIGLVAVAIPHLFGLGADWLTVADTLDPGELTILPGIAVVSFGLIWVSLWEELTMRGVFLCNTADGLRNWMSPHRAIAAAITLSALAFGLPHIAQTGHPAFIVTWILAGAVLGAIYVLSGSMAMTFGIHLTFNIGYQTLFVRTDNPGADSFSAILRIHADPALAFLQPGGVIDVAAWILVAALALAWLRFSRGSLSVDLSTLQLASVPKAEEQAATPATP